MSDKPTWSKRSARSAPKLKLQMGRKSPRVSPNVSPRVSPRSRRDSGWSDSLEAVQQRGEEQEQEQEQEMSEDERISPRPRSPRAETPEERGRHATFSMLLWQKAALEDDYKPIQRRSTMAMADVVDKIVLHTVHTFEPLAFSSKAAWEEWKEGGTTKKSPRFAFGKRSPRSGGGGGGLFKSADCNPFRRANLKSPRVPTESREIEKAIKLERRLVNFNNTFLFVGSGKEVEDAVFRVWADHRQGDSLSASLDVVVRDLVSTSSVKFFSRVASTLTEAEIRGAPAQAAKEARSLQMVRRERDRSKREKLVAGLLQTFRQGAGARMVAFARAFEPACERKARSMGVLEEYRYVIARIPHICVIGYTHNDRDFYMVLRWIRKGDVIELIFPMKGRRITLIELIASFSEADKYLTMLADVNALVFVVDLMTYVTPPRFSPWRPRNHRFFPKDVRACVEQLLFIHRFGSGRGSMACDVFCLLPLPAVRRVCRWLAVANTMDSQRLPQSLILFREVANHPAFNRTDLYLLFTQRSEFERSLRHTPFQSCFYNYKGSDNYSSVTKWLFAKFEAQCKWRRTAEPTQGKIYTFDSDLEEGKTVEVFKEMFNVSSEAKFENDFQF